MSEAAVMAQEEEDIRDYNLNEKQKATKAKYPPVNRKYECEYEARFFHLLPCLWLAYHFRFRTDPLSPVVVSFVLVRGV